MMKKVGMNMQKTLQQVMTQITSSMTTAMTPAMNQLGSGMEHALTIDPDAFAKAIHMNMSEGSAFGASDVVDDLRKCVLRRQS